MKRSAISLFLAALFTANMGSALAEVPNDASIYVTALKEEGIDEKILNSDIFKDCKDKIADAGDLTVEKGKDAIRTCLQEKLESVEDEQIEDFSSALKVDSLGFKETKNAKSLREYLSERIAKSIYGEKAYESKKLKEMKLVDHGLYLKLYKTQISKNLILEVSRYCLENVGIKGEPGAFITSLASDNESVLEAQEKEKKSFDVAFKKIMSKEKAELNLGYRKVVDTSKDPWEPAQPEELAIGLSANGDAKAFWDKLQEYKYCPNVEEGSGPEEKEDPCHKTRARNQAQINLLKNQELKWADADPDKIQAKYGACSNFIIKNMCELYRCNNVYSENSISVIYNKPAGESCRAFGVDSFKQSSGVSMENRSGDSRGQLACNLLERVETYKKTFAAIDEYETKNEALRGKGTGFVVGNKEDGGVFFSEGQYQNKNVDDITSISSKELVEKVGAFNEGEKEAEKLREECFQDGKFNHEKEECLELGGDMDGSDLAKIQLDTEAETALYLERLKKLKDGSDNDELKEYLIKHGLHDYVPMLEEDTIKPDKLVQLISDKYKADRQSLINNMNERFYSLTRKKSEKDGDSITTVDDIQSVAEDQVAEIENHKERLETLYNYSNIVSSYLQAKDDKGEKSENTRARQIEAQGFEEHAKDEANNYEIYFSESEGQKADATLSAQGQFIDDILGVGAKD